MTTPHGSDESTDQTAEPTTHRDGLEDWLQDLRTDRSNDPPGWLDADGLTSDAPHEFGLPPSLDHDDVEPGPAAAITAGRHRSKH
jgi:hypothetical protein